MNWEQAVLRRYLLIFDLLCILCWFMLNQAWLMPWYVFLSAALLLLAWRPETAGRLPLPAVYWDAIMLGIISFSWLTAQEGNAVQNMIRVALWMTVFYQFYCGLQMDRAERGLRLVGVSLIQAMTATGVILGPVSVAYLMAFAALASMALGVSVAAATCRHMAACDDRYAPFFHILRIHGQGNSTVQLLGPRPPMRRTMLFGALVSVLLAPVLFPLFPRSNTNRIMAPWPGQEIHSGDGTDSIWLQGLRNIQMSGEVILRIYPVNRQNVPTYWRGGVLTDWNGTEWTAWRDQNWNLRRPAILPAEPLAGAPPAHHAWTVEYSAMDVPRLYDPGDIYAVQQPHPINVDLLTGAATLATNRGSGPNTVQYWTIGPQQVDLATASRGWQIGQLLYQVLRMAKQTDGDFNRCLQRIQDLATDGGVGALRDPRFADRGSQWESVQRFASLDQVFAELRPLVDEALALDADNQDGLRRSLRDLNILLQLASQPAMLPTLVRQRCLQLPDDATHASFRDLAAQVTAGHTTDRDKLNALSARLRRNAYTTDLGSSQAAHDITDFITGGKAGHCEYFAGALAILLRGAGIPSRVCTGFMAVEYLPFSHKVVVRGKHAHAWVEAWVEEEGWLRIDPTPARSAEFNVPWWWMQIADVYDGLSIRWSRYVLGYTRSDQQSAAGSFLGRLLPQSVMAEWLQRLRQIDAPGHFRARLLELLLRVGIAGCVFAGVGALVWLLCWLVARDGARRRDRRRRSQLERLFFHAVRRCSRSTGIPFEPVMTCQEYIRAVQGRDPHVAELLAQMTEIYQDTRFGFRAPGGLFLTMQALAARLALAIKKGAPRGAPEQLL